MLRKLQLRRSTVFKKNHLSVLFYFLVLSVVKVKVQSIRVEVNESFFDSTTNSLGTSSSKPVQTDTNSFATSSSIDKFTNGLKTAKHQSSLDTVTDQWVTSSSKLAQADGNTLVTSTSSSIDKLTNVSHYTINQSSFDTITSPWVTPSFKLVQTDKNIYATSRSFDNLPNMTQFAIDQNSFQSSARQREMNSSTYVPRDLYVSAPSTRSDKPSTGTPSQKNQSPFNASASSEIKISATPFPADKNSFQTFTRFQKQIEGTPFARNLSSFKTSKSPEITVTAMPAPIDSNKSSHTSRSFVMRQTSYEKSTTPGIQSMTASLTNHRDTFQLPIMNAKLTTDKITASPGINSSAIPGLSVGNEILASDILVRPETNTSLGKHEAALETTIKTDGKPTTSTQVSAPRCITNAISSKLPEKEACEAVDKAFSDRLRQELLADTLYMQEIYLDQKGDPFFGISHKITRKDPEFHMPIGTNVSQHRVEEAYNGDVKEAIKSGCILFDNFKTLPEDVQLVILNMRFTLGHTGVAGFASFRQAVNSWDFNKAASEIERSAWYKQVSLRAKRLVDRMRAVAQRNIVCQ